MDKIIDTLILQRKDVKSEFHKFQKIIANFKDYPFGNKTIKNNVPGKPLEVNKSNSTSNFNNKYFNVITAKNILVNQLKNKLNQLNKLEEFNEELKDILQGNHSTYTTTIIIIIIYNNNNNNIFTVTYMYIFLKT